MSKPVRSKQSGQGLVEFALAFPVVFLLIIVIIEFGFAFNAYQTVVFAARAGARAGAVYLYQDGCLPGENEQNRESGTGCSANPYTENIRDTVAGSMPVARDFDPVSDVTINYSVSPRDDTNNPSRSGEILEVTVSYDYGFLTPILASNTITLTGTASQVIEK